jgi:GT2 family glycosyltransferase
VAHSLHHLRHARPHVDIIILTWNRPTATITAIQSALAQTGVERTIWVVDQGSEPANRTLLADFCASQPAVHVHWLGRHVGMAEGRNIASRLGTAPYIFSLDQDATFEDDGCLARAGKQFERLPQLGAIAFTVLDAETGGPEPYWDYPAAYLHSSLNSFEVTRFLGGGYGVRRSAFEAAGEYDARLFFGGEERDLAWRMLARGYRLRLYRDLAVLHKRSRESKLSWSNERYFYLVRNSLYIDHKFGAGLLGFVRGAASFALRGLRNGLCHAALRGIAAALLMSLSFSWRARGTLADAYRLSPELRRYISDTDHKTHETALQKLRRQLTLVPKV